MIQLVFFALAFLHSASASPVFREARVTKVYDGDTVVLDTGERVRVRWVNTPEMRPLQAYAEEAQRFAERLLLHRKVQLVMDSDKQKDGYGRLIAGIRVGDVDLSVALVERGLGHVFIIPPETLDITPLLAAQAKARDSRRGIWSTPRYRGSLHITSFHANAPGDDRENINGEYLRICNVSKEAVDLGNFFLRNVSGKKFRLPAVEIPAGHTVTVMSGQGIAQAEPTEQITAYLNSNEPVWDNDGDRATLLDSNGRTVDEERHGSYRTR